MAVDKKSDYVGDHGGAYTDNFGQSKQFSYIDHDKKTKISVSLLSDEEVKSLKDSIKEARLSLIDKILSIPAVYAPSIFEDFTIRGDVKFVTWNETMLRDSGLPDQKLTDIYTLTSNKMSLVKQGITL